MHQYQWRLAPKIPLRVFAIIVALLVTNKILLVNLASAQHKQYLTMQNSSTCMRLLKQTECELNRKAASIVTSAKQLLKCSHN